MDAVGEGVCFGFIEFGAEAEVDAGDAEDIVEVVCFSGEHGGCVAERAPE